MCKILNRIKDIADNEGITIAALERSIGASKGVIYKAISKGTDIQAKWLEAIVENYPQYSTHWLLTGEGEMLKSPKPCMDPALTESDPAHGINYVPPTSPTKDKPNSNLHRLSSPEHKSFDRILTSSRTPEAIPLVSVKAVGGFAGRNFSIQEQDIEGYYVIPKFRHLNVDFLIEVSGDSMMPRFFPGDIIACSVIHNPRFIQWNKPYLIATREDGMIVKRLNESDDPDAFIAVSDNEFYKPFLIPKSEIDGIARVVGVIHTE